MMLFKFFIGEPCFLSTFVLLISGGSTLVDSSNCNPKLKGLGPEAGLLNKRLMLSSSFRCDQIYKYDLYDFGHTLLCYLSQT
jgi:hypothetical protein